MESTEDKSLPATAHKLREARKKGQISKSADAVAAANLLVMLVVLATLGGTMAAQIEDLFAVAFAEAARAGTGTLSFAAFAERLGRVMSAALVALAIAIGPALVASLLGSIVANILLNKGILFTLEPMSPKLSALSPMKGFKKIFGKRGLFEFLKAVVKLAVMGATLVLVARSAVGDLMWLPACGFSCVLGAAEMPLLLVLGCALFLFIVAGGADILIQRRLFLDEMKMTKTEAKKERKEQEGDPQIQGARRRLAREAANETSPLGAKAATIFLYSEDAMTGLRYVPSESRVPVVVARAVGPGVMRLLAAARDTGAPILHDPRLAAALVASGRPGKPVPSEHFRPVAEALWRAGVAKK